MRCLIDTDIYLDVFTDRKPFVSESSELLSTLIKNNHIIFTSPKTFREIYNYAFRKTRDIELARNIVQKVYGVTNKIIDINGDDTINAMMMEGDYENNMIIASAKRNKLDAIITRDGENFSYKGITVFSPDEVILYLKNVKQALN